MGYAERGYGAPAVLCGRILRERQSSVCSIWREVSSWMRCFLPETSRMISSEREAEWEWEWEFLSFGSRETPVESL